MAADPSTIPAYRSAPNIQICVGRAKLASWRLDTHMHELFPFIALANGSKLSAKSGQLTSVNDSIDVGRGLAYSVLVVDDV